uniref:Uncharacterized protein n=1 Tax=Arundo donax TaxID=35708 RepID=A0A0A9HWB4_ARUDO
MKTPNPINSVLWGISSNILCARADLAAAQRNKLQISR